MNEQLELYDVTIIGGGPAGMYTAFYSGMRDLKTKLIEAKDELGGRMLIYPEKMIWDVGGFTPILCEKLIAQLTEQAENVRPNDCIRPAHCRIGETSGFDIHSGGGNRRETLDTHSHSGDWSRHSANGEAGTGRG